MYACTVPTLLVFPYKAREGLTALIVTEWDERVGFILTDSPVTRGHRGLKIHELITDNRLLITWVEHQHEGKKTFFIPCSHPLGLLSLPIKRILPVSLSQIKNMNG